jgi:hypothetical protein
VRTGFITIIIFFLFADLEEGCVRGKEGGRREGGGSLRAGVGGGVLGTLRCVIVALTLLFLNQLRVPAAALMRGLLRARHVEGGISLYRCGLPGWPFFVVFFFFFSVGEEGN